MADRYWRGGSGTWNSTNTANWSATSGGLGGASVPTSADDVYFNTASNAIAYTVTTSGNTTAMNCRNLSVAGPVTGSVTFSNTNSSVNIFGNLIHAASGVIWGTSVGLTLSSTLAGNTITTNGFLFPNGLTFNGIGGEWSLQDALTTVTTRVVTLTNGSLNLNNYTLTCGIFSSNVNNTRTLAFSTGKIVCSGNATTVFIMAAATGLTISGSRRVEFSYTGATGTRTIGLVSTVTEASSLDYYVLGGTDIVTTTGALRGARVLDFTGFAGTYTLATTGNCSIYGNLTFNAGMNISAAAVGFNFSGTSGTQAITTAGKTLDLPLTFDGIGGTFVFQDALTQGATRAFTITNGTVQLKAGATSTVGAFATSGTNQKFLQSTLAGSRATLSQASGTVNASYLTIKDINANGGATWNAFATNNNVNAGNNLGWDFAVQLGRYIYTVRKNKRILF